MTVALVYPPLCDPTAPYVSVPLLAACLRRAGLDVLAIDANAEAVDWLLRRVTMEGFAARVRDRFAELDGRSSLGLADQLDLVQLWEALPSAGRIPAAIGNAVATLRDPDRFFDVAAYERAAGFVQEAIGLAAAACAPLRLYFSSWRTPFSLLTPGEIRADALPGRDPFHAWYTAVLVPRLRDAHPGVVGVSVAFPGQVQPAFSMAHAIRAAMPGVHLVLGGPAASQWLARIPEEGHAAVLGPFDSAVVGEGEQVLVDLARAVEAGNAPRGVLQGGTDCSMSDLPPPDFAGMVPGPYLSPVPVLPYDAARGCYWGRCAFCHYGPVAAGTARYRERPAATVAEHLGTLSRAHGTRLFYLSEDTLSPRGARALADALQESGGGIRWATDLRPEPALDDSACRALREGGLLAVSIGVESACPRVLARIDKGVRVPQVEAAVRALSAAGVAVEAMAFTGFPGETTAEALQTVRWIDRMRPYLSLFICGEFALTHGSRVARDPAAFDVAETWEIRGDQLRTALFWRGTGEGSGPEVDRAVAALSGRWSLRSYPWAGSLSTAHTLLWYDRFGPDAFKGAADRAAGAASRRRAVPERARARLPRPRYDVSAVAETAPAADAAIWDDLVHRRREVSRAAWESEAARLPTVRPRGR